MQFFWQYSCAKKIQSQTGIREKLRKIISYEKGVSKMLMKLTPDKMSFWAYQNCSSFFRPREITTVQRSFVSGNLTKLLGELELENGTNKVPGINFINMLTHSFYSSKCTVTQLLLHHRNSIQLYQYTQLEVIPNFYFICSSLCAQGQIVYRPDYP